MKEIELSGTGLVESLYHYLWFKDRLNNNEAMKINLPDTVIYRNGKPCYWYFTARDGCIRRKTNENLNETAILNAFLPGKGCTKRCEIVGVFMYSLKNVSELYEIGLRTDVVAARQDASEKIGTHVDILEEELRKTSAIKESKRVIFEYFNEEGLGKELRRL